MDIFYFCEIQKDQENRVFFKRHTKKNYTREKEKGKKEP